MATRWQSSAKWTLVAVVAVVVLGGAAFWFGVLRGDAPDRGRPPVSTTETTEGAASVMADGDIESPNPPLVSIDDDGEHEPQLVVADR
jgi:hypothetical protein